MWTSQTSSVPGSKSCGVRWTRAAFPPPSTSSSNGFNGGLFRETHALDLTGPWIEQLKHAAAADWADVEPAIFGSLLERALDPREREKLGAHYTPRAYVERVVEPTLMEPLRAEWEATRAAAVKLAKDDDLDGARKAIKTYHRRLCEVRVLDPACGTGNFLYVSLELMKQLEGEVLAQLEDLGEGEAALEMEKFTVDPHQFLGLELNERAVAIAELVLWIGYLQWHFRTRGRIDPPEPILRDFKNIRYQDAILERGKAVLRRDAQGRPVSRWDGITMKTHPVTGEEVPDETARVEIEDFPDAKPAAWPEAEFIVGNPPFTGGKDIRQSLGDGWAEAMWRCHPKLPNSADLVMYWWDHAARLVRAGKVRRFGMITTNSLPQTFNRRVVQTHLADKKPLSLLFAIPDHPWVKALDRRSARGAAQVRVAMTVGAAGDRSGRLGTVAAEAPGESDSADVTIDWSVGKIWPNLHLGADLGAAVELRANERLASRGMSLHGAGFIVTPKQAEQLGLGRIEGLERHIRPYRNGKDLTARPRGVVVIDLFGLNADEVGQRFPAVYQWVAERVRPQREGQRGNTKDATEYAENWWLHGKPRSELRKALANLDRYIATVETSKHRFFQFLDISILPDNKLVNIGLSDAASISVLSSRIHVTWALAAGGRLGVGNDPVYVKTACFDKFPFPVLTNSTRARLADLGERLDALRKQVLADHTDLTMTGLYNVLARMREIEHTGESTLTAKERDIHDRGAGRRAEGAARRNRRRDLRRLWLAAAPGRRRDPHPPGGFEPGAGGGRGARPGPLAAPGLPGPELWNGEGTRDGPGGAGGHRCRRGRQGRPAHSARAAAGTHRRGTRRAGGRGRDGRGARYRPHLQGSKGPGGARGPGRPRDPGFGGERRRPLRPQRHAERSKQDAAGRMTPGQEAPMDRATAGLRRA